MDNYEQLRLSTNRNVQPPAMAMGLFVDGDEGLFIQSVTETKKTENVNSPPRAHLHPIILYLTVRTQ